MLNPYSAYQSQVRYQHRQLIAEADRARLGKVARARRGLRYAGRRHPGS
jgi:hypothetical protein